MKAFTDNTGDGAVRFTETEISINQLKEKYPAAQRGVFGLCFTVVWAEQATSVVSAAGADSMMEGRSRASSLSSGTVGQVTY